MVCTNEEEFIMPRFSSRSTKRLSTCHEDLQRVFKDVIKDVDCTVLCGRRNERDQNKAYREGKSKVKYPDGKHNGDPSLAVDVAPWPIDWKDRDRFHWFAGYVMGKAETMGITLRWGGNWRQDYKDGFIKNKFDDLVHFELTNK